MIAKTEKDIEYNRKLCEEMPYLIPKGRDGETVEYYKYDYIYGDYELPEGWASLFLQMCKDLKEPLEKFGLIDDFRFIQVKEKFGGMRVAVSCGDKVPTSYANEEIYFIISKYEYISQYVCLICGKPATRLTKGWIYPYCEDCFKTEVSDLCKDNYNDILFSPIWQREICKKGNSIIENIDCSDIWDRLYSDNIVTNLDLFRNSDINTLAMWLDKYSCDKAPWVDWFDKMYCQNCEAIIKEEDGMEKEYSYCELNGGSCRHMDTDGDLEIIKKWLLQKKED